MTSAESFDTEAIGEKNGRQEASKVPLYAVIGLAVLCAVLLIAVIALSLVLMGRDDIEGTDQPDSSGQTGSKHRAGDVEYPDIPEEDNSNVPSASAPASSPLSRPPPASQSPGSPVPGSRPSPSSVAQPSSSNNPAPQPGPPVVATTANGPAVAATSNPSVVDSSSANPNPPSPDSSSESSTMNAPQGSNGNSSSAHGELSPGPVDDKLYDSNRTAKLSAINDKVGTVKTSDHMLAMMNRTANPCNDFYNYACGGFAKSHLLKKNESLTDPYPSERHKLAEEMLRNGNLSNLKAAGYAKLYRQKCVELKADANSTESKGALEKWTLKMIDDFLAVSDIPFLTGSDGSNFSMAGSMEVSMTYNASMLLEFEGRAFTFNGTVAKSIVVGLHPSTATEDIRNESSKEFLSIKGKFEEAVKEMSLLKKINLTEAKINQTVDDLLAFEREFFEFSRNYNFLTIYSIPMFNISNTQFEFDKFAAKYNWSDGFEIKANINATMFSYLNNFIANISKSTLANYYVVGSFVRTREKFNNIDCDYHTKQNFLLVYSRIFEQLFPVEHSRQRIKDMLTDIADAMKGIFEKADWLSKQTRENAIKKLNATVHCIGFHDKIFEDAEIDAHYAKLKIEESDGFPVISQKFAAFALQKGLQNVGQIKNRTEMCLEWDFTQQNAAHSPDLNLMAIYSGILQSPLFDDGIPESILYGSEGLVIGHEFTHGFDNHGKNYGPHGEQMDWWTEEDNKKFNNRSQCLIDFFNNYTDPLTRLHENGTLTLGENIADLGGIKAALQAYRNFVKRAGKRPSSPPGLEDLTDEQIMFVSSTQFFCYSLNATVKADMIKTDEHALNRARMNNIATNTKEFADIFNCPLGSNHNPSQPRCEVW